MNKFFRNSLMAGVLAFGLAACGDDVTISEPPAPPAVPNITSFTVAPTAVTLTVGQVVQTSVNLALAPGLTGTVAYASGASTVATVDANGKITAVAPGTAVVTATATSAGQTRSATIGVTVTAGPTVGPASVSIASVTKGTLATPVNLSNVNGQIEINLNFDPHGALIDSVVSYIGNKRAAKQAYSASAVPAAGPISMSVNTANFVKNSTAGTTTVDFNNGPTTVNAIVYPAAAANQSAGNCANAPTGVASVCSSNTFSIILNNMDSWAADMTKPTTTALSAGGISYWGGPGTAGLTSVTLYPVMYTPGRTVTSVTWNVGGCTNVTQTALPFKRTWGYTAAPASAQTSCTSYQWTGGPRDNVAVAGAIDNAATPIGSGTMIPNTVVFNSTPDSIRLDYVAPTVTTPTITRAAPAVTGWVNAAFSFAPAASSDAGVGTRQSPDRAYFYNATNCGGATAISFDGTGNTIPECATNFIGGTVGLGSPGTAPYRAYLTESDRLGNVGTSAQTQTFGVDKTAPAIRWGTVDGVYPLPVSISADTTTFTAKPTPGTNVFRAEYLDERSGFVLASAQRHSIAIGNHLNPTGACLVGTGSAGASFVTAPTCTSAAATPVGAVRLDGWQPGAQVDVPQPESYYAYTTNVTDASGNTSASLFAKALVNAAAPFATGLGIPAQLTAANFGFQATGADSAEISSVSLQVVYPSIPGTTDSLRYTRQSIGTRFDNVITSPFTASALPSTGAPYAHSIEVVDGTAFPGVNTSAGVQAKPTKVQTWSWNFGGFSTASTEIAIPALNVENNATIAAFNAANPTIAVNHWRVIPTVATSNQFGSTVPLRAQAVAPTNSPNPPFARVDFYRLVGTYYSYLGSVSSATVQLSATCNTTASVCGTDQGTYRSWVYQLPVGSYVTRWDGVAQTVAATGNTIIAVGVLSTGDAISTTATVMP